MSCGHLLELQLTSIHHIHVTHFPTLSISVLMAISRQNDLEDPSSLGGLPTLPLTTNSSWLPSERVAMPLISPLMPVPYITYMLHTFQLSVYVYICSIHKIISILLVLVFLVFV